ncbi:uncharacterized protein Fot_02389 [Forsythia ovata]|uniref:Uncharacterized protein n=1 Tax=Forsythia ovata TaxID=205694 RepID=A0ABD1X7L9_9LAMI
MGVSRPRLLSSFRDEASDYAFSSAKFSNLKIGGFIYSKLEPRKSGFKCGFDVEMDGSVYCVPYRSVYPYRESDFSAMDESSFIVLNLDLSAKAKFDQSRILIA